MRSSSSFDSDGTTQLCSQPYVYTSIRECSYQCQYVSILSKYADSYLILIDMQLYVATQRCAKPRRSVMHSTLTHHYTRRVSLRTPKGGGGYVILIEWYIYPSPPPPLRPWALWSLEPPRRHLN